MKQKEKFVLEWSPSQQCFHIQLLELALEANRKRFNVRHDATYDWSPLFIGTYRECELVARHNEKKLAAKTQDPEEAFRWTH
jgi:hypothetical protein